MDTATFSIHVLKTKILRVIAVHKTFKLWLSEAQTLKHSMAKVGRGALLYNYTHGCHNLNTGRGLISKIQD